MVGAYLEEQVKQRDFFKFHASSQAAQIVQCDITESGHRSSCAKLDLANVIIQSSEVSKGSDTTAPDDRSSFRIARLFEFCEADHQGIRVIVQG